MKKAIVALAIAAIASTASAAILGSKHDLSVGFNGALPTTLSSCQFCHAPHNANTTGGATGYVTIPLWNRSTSSATYNLRTPGSLAVPVLGTASLTCLSCHDGVADVGATFGGTNGLAGAPNKIPFNGAAVPGSNVGSTYNGTVYVAAAAGTADLRDDHPVGIPLVVASDYQVIGNVTPTLKLYGAAGDRVECSTCHDPHGANPKFIRGVATALCSTCHLK